MNTSLPEPNVAAASQSALDQIIRYDSGSDGDKTAWKDVNPSSKPKIDIAPDQLRDMLLGSISEALREHSKYHNPKTFSRQTKSLVSKTL
ncbi:hypothetical protein IM774_11495 [Erysipelotrichaceae bacterium RD49]|nr:hypothetical protein [Erysipelotrichaceae bacterium RD49]